ncbi:MAG: sigma-70 family RNA polymerase sigma factor [Anaerolineales bacterium]|nr:sigma-70 family RNA polymerase sigma factor [Anaerolineales bacterium]
MTDLPELSWENELDLVLSAQQGDKVAFCELVRIHRNGVINLLYRMYGDTYSAEDTAQETFIRAWQKLQSYKPKSPFRNWLYRIATNAALDAIRREREVLDVDAITIRSQDEGPEAQLETKETGEQVREAVLRLAPSSRAVLVLREYEGFSYKEIAETLDIPTGTVMSRLNYARNQLRKSLNQILEG